MDQYMYNNPNKANPPNMIMMMMMKRLTISSDDSVEQRFSAMVRDFMEKSLSSGTPRSANYSSDDEAPPPPDTLDDAHQLLQDILTRCTLAEKDLTSLVRAFLCSIQEEDLTACHVPSRHHYNSYCYCQGMCIYGLLSEYLRSSGYNAAVCNSKWPKSGRIPGGQHTYVDVIFDPPTTQQDRLIIDIDFCTEFEIARPTLSYDAAKKALPLVFVGSSKKLSKLLAVMAREARKSLKRNAMPIPPWRTLDYMASKWKAPSERQTTSSVNVKNGPLEAPHHPRDGRSQSHRCVERLRHLNLSMGVV